MTADSDIRFRFENREISSPAGVSLAAALAGAGEYGLRAVDERDRRGVFCGIGVCQECAVDVEGQGRVRACMTTAAESMQVRRAERLVAPMSSQADASPEAATVSTPDVLVIGGGAAGLTAAALLAENGADVVLLDERGKPGGQYYKQPAGERVHASLAEDAQILEGGRLVERARASGARIVEAAEVWGAFAPGEFIALHDGVSVNYRPRRTIVATGAYERGLPLPGWTLPGVMTSGAAQTMLKSYGELPGQRVLVAGNGPLNLQIAVELDRAGADVVAVTELAQPFYRRPMAAIGMLGNDVALSLRGLRTVAALRSAGIPLRFGHGVESIEASANGLKAWIGRLDDRRLLRREAVEVDVVCMGYGFLPSNEILRNLGCRHSFDKSRGQLTVDRSGDCETSVPGIYAIGDCCGLGGAPAAREEGTIAAAAILADVTGSDALTAEEQSARRRLRSHRGFQAALWRMFEAPRLQSELADEGTVVCRCESVRLGDIREAIAAGDQSIGAIKRRTRLGMGACQGRYCAAVAADLLARETGEGVGEYSFFAPRVPVKPVRISDIARARPKPDASK